jgi:AcrR family transcriptional regulator
LTPASPRRRGRRRTRTKLAPEEVRSRLYHGALARFRERGFDGVSVSELTREAGVAKGTFFNHFPTKDHVLSAAHEELVGEALEEVAGEGLTGTAALLATFELLARGLESDRRMAALLFERWSLLPSVGSDGDDARFEGGHTSDLLRGRVREWIDGTLSFDLPVAELEPEALASLLLGAYSATVTEWATGESAPFPLVSTLRRRLAFLLRAAALPDT